MASVSRIAELASLIQIHTLRVDEYISSNGLPSPSFDADMPAQLHLPERIQSSSTAVIEATSELHSLMLGPMGFLLHQVDSPHNLISLHAISRFQMASSFPVDKETTVAKIAQKCQLDEDETRRILRHAITNHIFAESKTGSIVHTAASSTLAQVPLLREWLEQACDDMWPAASRYVDAMARWPASGEPTQTAFNIAFDTPGSYFDETAKSPNRVQKFADAMSFFCMMPGFELGQIVSLYDWASLDAATVVDVGGSSGAAALEIVRAFPSVRVVVQDLPEVINNACSSSKTAVHDRVTFEAHDFFGEQTLKGADVYFFRMILHDWSDKYCIRILRNLIPALKQGAKILINDFCLPDPGTISQYQERNARCHDLAMKAVFNAKERDLKDWTNLFLQADLRFKFTRVHKLASSALALIEVGWDEDL